MTVPSARNTSARKTPRPAGSSPERPSRRAFPAPAAARWSAIVLLGLAATGCGGGGDTVATDLRLSRVVTGQGVDLRLERETLDAAALRTTTPGSGSEAPGGGVNAAAPSTAPSTMVTVSPPTLAAPPTVAETTAAPSAPATDAVTATTSTPPLADPAVSTTVAASPTNGPVSSAPSMPDDTPTTTTPVGPTTTVPAPPVTADEAEMGLGEAHSLGLVNELRAGQGLAPLTRDPAMDAFARDWSKHMAESGVFDHSPSPYGENIAFTSNTNLTAAEAADAFHRLWQESETHYKNMTTAYVTVGIGVYKTERGWYGTHVFSY